MKHKKHISVIGSGVAGLAVAIRMAVKGCDVNVYEKSKECGGKLVEFELDGFRFDFGPSLFTMPQYVLELFEIAGKNPSDYFEFHEIPEACRYFFSDGTEFIAPTDENEFINLASQTFDVSSDDLKKFMEENKKIFMNAGEVFLTHSLQKLSTWTSKKVLKSVFHSYVFNMLYSMHQVTSSRIKDKNLVQLFDRYATYNGSSPYLASSILNSISSLEHNYGTYFPVGGMSSITKSLERLAKEIGVKFHYNHLVEEIIYEKQRVKGIRVKNQFIDSDIVVSNMDVQFTYSKLMNMNKPLLEKREKSSSAVIFYWGINRKFTELGLHNIIFSENYKLEFEDIFVRKNIPTDPTIYINISSKFNPSDAPENGENWFVMVNVPANFGQNWDNEIDILKKKVIHTIGEKLKVDLKSCITCEYIADPRVIEDKTLSHRGSLYGTSSNHWLSAFLRHPNFTNAYKNLYFVGGTVHPGGGIPLCLLSAKITSDLIS